MTDQQLYIDGIQMDIGDDTSVILDIKSNLFRDVTKIAANNTYTINLPKTAHNLSVLEHSDKPKASTRYPYVFHTARYFRNGLEIIRNGRLTVLSISETIETVIYWGIFPAFTALQDEDMKLNGLKTDARLPFERKNTIDKYGEAVARGYFYASYNYKKLQYFENDWQGRDRLVGGNDAVYYELVYGKVATGTEVGATVKGTIESDAGYKYAFIPFHVGSTARIRRIIGVGSYRSYAVLDTDKNVLAIADEAREGGGEGEIPVPTGTASTDRIDYNVMWANDNVDALTVRTIKVEVGTVVSDTKIEYGVVKDMRSYTYEKWGEISVSAGTTGTVTADVGKAKKTGERLYLKTARGGVLLMKTVSGESCYEIYSSLTYRRYQNKQIAYGFTYGNAGIQAEDYTIVAPQNAAYLIINANQDYSVGTELIVTGNIDTTESGGWLTDPTEQPSVSVPWVLGLIKQQTGVGFSWPAESQERIDTLAIPLVTRNGDGKSIVGNLRADFVDTQKLGVMRFNVTDAISTLGQTAGNTYSSLTVKKECTLRFNVQLYWRWNASFTSPQGKRTWITEDGSVRTENYYQYPFCYVEIKVKSIDLNGEYKEENEQTYIVGTTENETQSKFATSTESQKVDGYFEHLLTGEGNLELKEKDIVTFELKNTKNSVLYGMIAYDGFVKATVGDASEVPYGGSYPIGINLPEIGVLDFVRFLSLLTGVFPRQVNNSREIEFVRISEIWEKKNEAINWTRKLIPFEARNTPRKSEFSVSDYKQHNLYLWQEDDTVVANYDADIRINNETLEYTQDVWKMPFAASDGDRVPIYGWKQEEVLNAAGETVNVLSASDYKACKDRIMGLYKNGEGKAALTFDIELQKAFDTKYARLTDAISKAHVITEWLNLSDLEILNFDETKPVYLAQYGAYFAVLEIKTTSSWYSEVTMIELKN